MFNEMDKKEYVFLTTFFDKELLRKAILILEAEHLDFKMINKATHGSFRAPLSVFVEADIQVLSSDYEKAAKLLEALMA